MNTLHDIVKLPRGTSFSTLQDKIRIVLNDNESSTLLPPLLCYLRNHTKSQAPGSGSGERDLVERCVVALYGQDEPAALMMLPLMVAYGSYKSLLNILILCDNDRQLQKSNSYPSESPLWALCQEIHRIFAAQLQADDDGKKAATTVSNASKFAPHEKRGRKLNAAHGDAIAAPGTNLDKHGRRRLYRKLRARLNSSNPALPDRFLALQRSDEIKVDKIPAGYWMKSRKALLNVQVKNPTATRYTQDPARIRLAQRIKEKTRAPVPVDMNALATKLLQAVPDSDEYKLLEATYESGVQWLANKIIQRRRKIHQLEETLSQRDVAIPRKEHGFVVAEHPTDCLVVVENLDYSREHNQMAAMMSLFCGDAIERVQQQSTTGTGATIMANEQQPRQCLVSTTACCQFRPVPPRQQQEGVQQKLRDRLSALLEEFANATEVCRRESPTEHNPPYDHMMRTLKEYSRDHRNASFFFWAQCGEAMDTAYAKYFNDEDDNEEESLGGDGDASDKKDSIEVIAGTGLAVTDLFLNGDLIHYKIKLEKKLNRAAGADEEERKGGPLSSALESLISKLESSDYDMVRQAMHKVDEGLYAGYVYEENVVLV